MATLNVRDFGAGRSQSADDGAIQGALDAANNGDKIFFPENNFNDNCYVINGTLTLNKNVLLEAESSRVLLRKSTNSGNLLVVTLSGNLNYFDINRLGFQSASNQVVVSVTGSMSRVVSIAGSVFAGAAGNSFSLFCNGATSNPNLKLTNVSMTSGTTALLVSGTTNFHNISLNNCEFQDTSVAAVRVDKIANTISSGNLSFGQNVFVNCTQGVILGSVTGSFLGNYFGPGMSNTVLSGNALVIGSTNASDLVNLTQVLQPTVRTVAGSTDTVLAGDIGNVVFYSQTGSITVTLATLAASIAASGTGLLTFQATHSASIITVRPTGSVLVDATGSNYVAATGKARVSLISYDRLNWYSGAP